MFTLALAIVLGWAGVAKVVSPAEWRGTVGKYALPGRLAPVAAVVVPTAELLTAILLLASFRTPALQVAASLCAAALLALFSLAILRLRTRVGNRLPCGCFGRRTERDYRVVVLRNVVLLMMSVYLYADAARISPAPDAHVTLPLLLVIAGVALAGWVVASATSALRKR